MSSLDNKSHLEDFDWIKDYLQSWNNFQREDIESVLNFSLFWNLFEGQVFDEDKSADINIRLCAQSLVQESPNIPSTFAPYLEYFRNRYVSNGSTNPSYDNLQWEGSHGAGMRGKTSTACVLKGEVTSSEEIIKALLWIVYRLRNNLFHGIKKLQSIRGQRENFETANQIIRRVLEIKPRG